MPSQFGEEYIDTLYFKGGGGGGLQGRVRGSGVYGRVDMVWRTCAWGGSRGGESMEG